MYQQDRILDSYQNEVTLPGRNESIESAGTDAESEDVNIQREADPYEGAAARYVSDGMWSTDEDAERVFESEEPAWRGRRRDLQGRWTKD